MHSREAEFAVQPGEFVFARIRVSIKRANLPRLLFITGQLLALAYVVKLFDLEHSAFHKVMFLTVGGFVIHHLLPMPARLPFFVLLSLGSLVYVLQVENAARLIGVGLLLIGLCHLPVRFGWRLVLISGTAIVLILGRADRWVQIPGYEAIWPILGSMFMFRLIIYLYDLKHGSAPFDFWRSLAYFFMLPNVCFPMYPVVEYQSFNRNYFDESHWKIYQIGVKWILRGIIHLLLYRLINQNLVIQPTLVIDAGDMVRYMLTTYLLYLQISGQFHVIIGMLHLFGFNLPETHHLYYLSSSFTDFWRRINIYWKDFILKIFFNPVYFKCKKWGPTAAMVIATLVAFFFTWLLHSYQWFWIRGTFPLLWNDMFFWGILAMLVLVNALYEQRHGLNRKLKGSRWSLADRALIGVKTIGTFCAIITLWCLWTFQGTFNDWLVFMSNFAEIDLTTALLILTGLLALGVISGCFASVGREYSAGQKLRKPDSKPPDQFPFWRSVAASAVVIMVLLTVVKFYKYLPLGETVTNAVVDLKMGLSRQERLERDRGYYEDLTNTKSYNLALWELYSRTPEDMVRLEQTELAHLVPDQFHQIELAPSRQAVIQNVVMTTNRWGMRDREYEKHKPPGTHRTVILGASISMGTGVNDDETYENLLEDRFNREFGGQTHRRFEILNFSVAGYKSFQKLWAFERSLEFEPDAVLWVTHALELYRLTEHLADTIFSDMPIPYPELRQWLESEGLNARTNKFELKARLDQMTNELLIWILQRINDQCRQRGIEFEVIVLPRADQVRRDEAHLHELAELAHQLGLPTLDIRAAYRSAADRRNIAIAPGDAHPNARGHQLLAGELYRQMLASPYWQKVLGAAQTPSAD